jgi:hypothetical protein
LHHITFKNNSLKNIIKHVFDLNLHHDPVMVQIEEGLDGKRDGFTTFRGQYSKMMGR